MGKSSAVHVRPPAAAHMAAGGSNEPTLESSITVVPSDWQPVQMLSLAMKARPAHSAVHSVADT